MLKLIFTLFTLVPRFRLAACALTDVAGSPESKACLVQTSSVKDRLGMHKKRLTEDAPATSSSIGSLSANAAVRARLSTTLMPVPAPPGSREEKDKQCIDDYRRGLNEVQPDLGDSVQSATFKVANVSEKPLILGAGFGTTGTTSTAAALSTLGQRVSHCCNIPVVTDILAPVDMGGLLSESKLRNMTPEEEEQCWVALSKFDYTSIAHNVDAIFDTPVAETFLYLWRSFPNAKVVLTTRNSKEWVDHRFLFHKHNGFKPMQNPCGQFLGYPKALSHEQYEAMFDLHSKLVRCMVPENQLLEVNLFEMSDKDETKLLSYMANFIGVPIPESLRGADFPHVAPHLVQFSK